MPKFHAWRGEVGASVTYWNTACISYAQDDERAETLKITLVDRLTLSLQGQDATDVIEPMDANEFAHMASA
jgi:hypothetical protein